jgi:hypothetical protein
LDSSSGRCDDLSWTKVVLVRNGRNADPAAQHPWEITQVNEMLTQMEQHPYPFVPPQKIIEGIEEEHGFRNDPASDDEFMFASGFYARKFGGQRGLRARARLKHAKSNSTSPTHYQISRCC